MGRTLVTPTRSSWWPPSVILTPNTVTYGPLQKLLDATCPNHTFHFKRKLKESFMMKNYMGTGSLARAKKSEGDSAGKAATPFPEEKAVMSIYG
jgi:hypothetical protein